MADPDQAYRTTFRLPTPPLQISSRRMKSKRTYAFVLVSGRPRHFLIETDVEAVWLGGAA
ncbi:hypothetical protein X742_26420 [Mesorhizobium sp. LNHC232B00]|nr:hypothetical protein X742_26420 [Mesorhizobium sp. LNHC232B00]